MVHHYVCGFSPKLVNGIACWLNRQVLQDATFEVVLYFTRPSSRAWSDIMVTVDGHEVFAETRKKFKPGPGEDPAFLMKRFEVRAGN